MKKTPLQTKMKTEKTNKKEIKEATYSVGTRGRVFEGTVTKRFPMRVVVEFERTVFVHKYDRFYKVVKMSLLSC